MPWSRAIKHQLALGHTGHDATEFYECFRLPVFTSDLVKLGYILLADLRELEARLGTRGRFIEASLLDCFVASTVLHLNRCSCSS